MTKHHDRRRVSEPVQVYLGDADRARLDRLTAALDATKSDVLREALQALEAQVTDVAHHPALSIIGIAGDAGPEDPIDAAREHDRVLADAVDSSAQPSSRPRKRSRRGR